MCCFRFIGFVFLCIILPDIYAQKPRLGDPTGKSSEELDTLSRRSKNTNFLITPYVAPTYTPELKLLISVGGLISFKVQPKNPLVERSSIPFSIGQSTNGATSITILPYIYGNNDMYRILTKFYYRNMPDNYWGVGYDAGNKLAVPNNTTGYHREWVSLEGSVVRKITKGFFVGLSYDFNSTKATDLNSDMSNDSYIIKYGKNITNFGLGLAIKLDRRDNVQNPYTGYLVSLSFKKYNRILKFSDSNGFSKITLDLRKYFSIQERKTLALQYKLQSADRNTPWSDLPQLGTPFDLRGYQWGRFRDRLAMFGISEYRHMFSGQNMPSLQRYLKHLGFVIWTGFGSVAPAYDQIEDFIFNVGAGLRVEIQPRLNLRVDYGIARDSKFIYISFSEAF